MIEQTGMITEEASSDEPALSSFASLVDIPVTVIEPSRGLSFIDLQAFWHYRELLYFLVWRDIKVRYKQTALGVIWVILQPLASMAIFTILFGVLLDAPSGEVPYPLFAFAGLLPWNYFSFALTRSSTSVVTNANLVTKIYFPRVMIPLSAVISGLVDFVVSLLVFVVMMVLFAITPTWAILLLPLFLLLAMLTSLGFGLWLSALNVRYRDINHLAPFIVQIWMYLTPVVYATTLIPERFRFLLSLNPMTGVIEGFRWALFGPGVTDTVLAPAFVALSVGIALVVFFTGLVFFRTTEKTFADIV